MSGNGGYYRPYQESPRASDEEPISDTDAGLESSEYDSDYSYETQRGDRPYAPTNRFDPPDRAELYRMGGPALLGNKGNDFTTREGAPFDKSGWDAKKPINYGKTEFKTASKGSATMVLVDSLNRDRVAYPQPTQLQLHLPRVYRNVTGITITQMKLLSAFLYFRNNKYNTNFKVYEEGRTLPGNGSNIIDVNIREGSYSINELLQELTYQMNTTPTFFHFPNDFNDFASAFAVNGDLGLNFNLPGDYYYDSLLQKFVANPTSDYIITRYFVGRYAGQSIYTLGEIQVAYYYPVLKEALLDPKESVNITLPLTGDPYNRIVFGFQGLQDTYVLSVIQANVIELDRYRDTRTFQNSLVNNYIWTLNSFNKRVNVASSNLNTSIVNNITLQSNIFLSNELAAAGTNLAAFTALSNFAAQANAVLNSMYNYYQAVLASNFAINYGSYTLPQLASGSNYIFLQNGFDVSGVFTGYSAEYISSINNGSIKPLPDFNYVPSSPVVQWPNMSNMATPTIDWLQISTGLVYINSNLSQRYDIYEANLRNIDYNTPLTTDQGIVNATLTYGSAELVVNISAGQYVLLPIRSPCRQTLQVETLPRPYRYRYPDFNGLEYGGGIPSYFNRDYTYGDNNGASTSLGINYYNYSNLTYGLNRESTINASQFSTVHSLQITDNYKLFRIEAPAVPPTVATGGAKYDWNWNIEILNPVGGNFTETVGIFLYHDRAAYMADAANIRNENSLNYLTAAYISTTSSVTIPINAVENQEYYLIVRPDNTFFANTNFKVAAWWPVSTARVVVSNFDIQQPGITVYSEQYGSQYADTVSTVNYNFYNNYNPAAIELPINVAALGIDPSDNQFNVIYPTGAPVIGYDDNDISNDMTNYIGFTSSVAGVNYAATFRQDPINRYTFMCNSPYNSTAQSYFYSGSSNTVLTAQTNAPYNPVFSNTTMRTYNIVHYQNDTFIGPQSSDAEGYLGSNWDLTGLCTLQTMAPYTSTTTSGFLNQYEYSQDANLEVSTFRLGSGVIGFSFLPTEGVWDMRSVYFKSAYYGPGDPNSNIAYLGIFDTNALVNQAKTTIDIRQSYAALSCITRTVYTPSTVGANQGFDASYGTYHYYELIDGFTYSRPDLVGQGIPGYTPYPSTVINTAKNLYTVVPFDSNFSTQTYFMLAGSAVPFPDNCSTIVSTSYNGTEYDGYGVALPVPDSRSTQPYIRNIYQSQYELSLPVATTALSYLSNLDIINDPIAMFDYSPFGGFVGQSGFALRAASYQEGDNQFLLFGGLKGNNVSLCDIYYLRNPGGVSGVRDTVYVDTFDLSNYITPGEELVTWGANSYSIFIMTRPMPTGIGPASNDILIYELSSITLGGTATAYQDLNMDLIRWGGKGEKVVPTFSGPNRQLRITDRKDWVYSDTCYTVSTIGTQLGAAIIAYNAEPTLSSFTAISMNESESNYNFLNWDIYVDTCTHPCTNTFAVLGFEPRGSSYSVTGPLFGDISVFYFSTATSYTVDANGILNNNDVGFAPGGVFKAGLALPQPMTLSTLRMTSDETFYALDVTAPGRFQKLLTTSTAGAGSPFWAYSNVIYEASASGISSITEYPTHGFEIDTTDGFWFSFQTGDILSERPYNIVGNAQKLDDFNQGIPQNAFQVFYPASRVVLYKRLNKYNDITNLVDIDYNGSNYYEFPKTLAFYYPNFDSVLRDVSTTVMGGPFWKWGAESNFTRADTEFNGYGYNSYIYNIPLSTSGVSTAAVDIQVAGLVGNPNDYSWIALRGYSPNEDYQVLVRLNLPNRYDYGVVNPTDIIREISTVIIGGDLSLYNPNYIESLTLFDNAFNITQTYGAGSLPGFGGSNITTINYSTFFSTFSERYLQYASSTVLLSSVQGNVAADIQAYISTYYGTILPSTIYDRLRITDALPFDLLFSTSVASQVARRDVDWGLGYNLGFERRDYGGNTVYTAPTFYKIIDDYIYLQINPEQSMNRLDTTGREILSTSQESTGEVSKYYGKLLLANFGSYAQTMIGTTAAFNPPLGRLDKLMFNWVDLEGNVIDNNDCDWSAAIQVNEEMNLATVDSLLPKQ